MNEMITKIYKVDCPISLRIKYWFRAYEDLNSDLIKGHTKIFLACTKLLHSGLTNNCINANAKDDLYRGALKLIKKKSKILLIIKKI